MKKKVWENNLNLEPKLSFLSFFLKTRGTRRSSGDVDLTDVLFFVFKIDFWGPGETFLYVDLT